MIDRGDARKVLPKDVRGFIAAQRDGFLMLRLEAWEIYEGAGVGHFMALGEFLRGCMGIETYCGSFEESGRFGTLISSDGIFWFTKKKWNFAK